MKHEPIINTGSAGNEYAYTDGDVSAAFLSDMKSNDLSHVRESYLNNDHSISRAADDLIAHTKSIDTTTGRVAFLGKVQEFAVNGAWHELNAAISGAPIQEITTTWLITMLRGTFRFREMLPNWENFRDAVKIELDDRGTNSARLLRGL